MNREKRFFRITLVLSILPGLFFSLMTEDHKLLIIGLVFVWAVHFSIKFIVRGFNNTIQEDTKSTELPDDNASDKVAPITNDNYESKIGVQNKSGNAFLYICSLVVHDLFSIKGRISRSTFWYISISITIFNLLNSRFGYEIDNSMGTNGNLHGLWVLAIIFLLILSWSGIAISIKRCHDRNHSGWFLLLGLIPIVGSLWILIEIGFLKGTDGGNHFGSDPLLRDE